MVDAVFFAPPWHDCFVDVGGAFLCCCSVGRAFSGVFMPAMRVLFLMICLPPRALRLMSLGVGLFHGLFVAGLLGFCLF